MISVLQGDCCEIMPMLESESFDAIVTDPPAGISFMSKTWDGDKGGRDHWIAWMKSVASECLRVAKPGAHALVWALPRTSHWTATAWENAGWEVRDRIAHLFGVGFPKSLNVSYAIDDHFFHEWLRAHPEQAVRLKGLKGEARKEVEDELRRLAGLERKVVGESRTRIQLCDHKEQSHGGWQASERTPNGGVPITAPATPEAAQWTGWGTALKPACEDWWLLRKPLSERTVAANVLAHGTGVLNIDACRVQSSDQAMRWETPRGGIWSTDSDAKAMLVPNDSGRWPANLIHDGSQEVLDAFAAFGERGGAAPPSQTGSATTKQTFGVYNKRSDVFHGGSGSSARFFFSAKANAEDRLGSRHPTIKPTDLMAWLLRLVVPHGGHVLDPFAGSGSTGMAAMREGFDATLIELEEESVKDIRNRLAHVHGHDTPLFAAKEDAEQPTLDLFDGAA